MANTFKNGVKKNIGTVQQTVYTATTTAIVTALSLTNNLTSAITATVTLTDTSAGIEVNLIKDAPIPPGSSLVAIGSEQKIVLENADIIKVTGSTANAVDAAISVLEQS